MVDFSRDSALLAKKLFKFRGEVDCDIIVADACYLPFRNRSFDLVFSDCTIEHIPNYTHAIKECARVCEDFGHVIITVPNKYRIDGWDSDTFLGKLVKGSDYPYHQRLYFTAKQLKELMKAVGLEPKELFEYGTFFAGIISLIMTKILSRLFRKDKLLRLFAYDKMRRMLSSVGIEVGIVAVKKR